ncbi:MAG: aquaporin [Gemmataceae bacterium]
MKTTLSKAFGVELLAMFVVVYFSAGIVCVNFQTFSVADRVVPASLQKAKSKAASKDEANDPQQKQEGKVSSRPAPGTMVLYGNQPGLLGIALAQGLTYAVMLAVTMHLSGGYLNPAITIMLWVYQRLGSRRALVLLGAQFVGAFLAGLCIRASFSEEILTAARYGTPHLNPNAYPEINWASLFGGASIELVLTFFLVFAIFGAFLRKADWPESTEEKPKPESKDELLRTVDARIAALMAGLALTVCVLLAFPSTGAATNPARWFGTVLFEGPADAAQRGRFSDMFVYLGGPVVGALMAGFVYFWWLTPEVDEGQSRKKSPKKK